MKSEKFHVLHHLFREMVFFRSPRNRLHSQNVAVLSTDLAESIGCTGDQVAQVYFGALFHDIGKQFVSNNILNKPNMLTRAEFNQIQSHPWKGYIHLHQFSLDNIILKIVLHHHEHWNGSGYPCRLKQNEIPLEARICTVVDVWDALVSKRCYRDALDRSQALDYIWKGSGILFDPEIVLSFIKLVEEKQMRKNSSERPVLAGSSEWTGRSPSSKRYGRLCDECHAATA